MCRPSCFDVNSVHKLWIEIDAQILNALFCIPAFGLAPWRARDLYFLIRWRCVRRDNKYHRKLTGLYRGWYRLPGSDKLPEYVAPPTTYSKVDTNTEEAAQPWSPQEIAELEANDAIPLPVGLMPDPPLTGIRASPTRSWTLDILILCSFWNTIFQATLAGYIWGTNRFMRLGTINFSLIAAGCVTGTIGVLVAHVEGRRIQGIEGIPIQEYDVLESTEDFQRRQKKRTKKEIKGDSEASKRQNQLRETLRRVMG